MDQPGNSRVAAKKQSPPVVSAPKTAEPMAAAADIGPISAYEQLASLSADGRPNPAHVLALQRAAGNRAVSRFMAGRTVQTKVNTEPAAGKSSPKSVRGARQPKPLAGPGAAGKDASRSRARPAVLPSAPAAHPRVAQRQARLDDEDLPGLPPAPGPGAGFDASPDFEGRLSAARGGGAPLPDPTRAFMEQRIGADFSGVKVHTDAQSDALNQAIQARAFTTGQDVFFRQGEFEPATTGGKALIAHELTHVVQQTGAAMRAPEPDAPAPIVRTTAGERAIQAKGDGTTTDITAQPVEGEGPTAETHIPTLEEELVAEGAADSGSLTIPAPKARGLAKIGASVKSAVRAGSDGDPVKQAIDKLDRAAVERIIELIAKDQLEYTSQQLAWLGRRNSALQSDPSTYETTLQNELAWEKAASISELDRPGLERILRLINENKLKAGGDELQQLGRRRQALLADASTYETTLATELAFEQVKGISELDRDGVERIITLIDEGKLKITPTELQQLGRRRKTVGGAGVPGETTLADALAREGVESIGALDFDGVERVVDLVDEKKLRLEPAQLQQLGRRRAALEAAGNKAAKITMAVALAREGVETIEQLDLAGVDNIADLIPEKRLDITARQIQQLGERRRKVLTEARTVTQYLKDKQAAELANGTRAQGTRPKKISELLEGEAEAILDLVEKKALRATQQEQHDLGRFRKIRPAEREQYETTFADELAFEGATRVDQLSVEAAERIRELVADRKLKVTTAQLQQLARLTKAKPAPGAEKTTLKKELARHGAATIDELDLDGIEALRRLVAEKKLDLTVYYIQELGRRHKLLSADQRASETTLEIEMAREGLEAQEFDKLDLDGVERILSLVAEDALKLGTPTLLALGRQRNTLKAAPAERKTTLALEMARHGATGVEELDLEGVEAILELTVAEASTRLEAPVSILRELGQRRRKLLEERETRKPTLAQELKLRAAQRIEDLNLEALDEIHELIMDGKLRLLPTEREQLERRRKQQREAANAGKPKLEELLAWEGAETIAELDLEAANRILDQIRYAGLKVETSALLELVRRRKALSVGDEEPGTFEDELANEGALSIADLGGGGVDRIWDLVEAGKLEVTNAQLLELARRRKEFAEEARVLETSMEEELAREDVDGISELGFEAVRRIWKLVERAALEISPDQLRELAQRRKTVLSAPRTYETTLEYELARARANSIADLDMSDVSSILELAEAGDLELSNAQLAQLVRRQKEEAYDGRALKALLSERKDRSIGSLTPLWVSILWNFAEQKKLPLSADQRRDLAQRRKDQAANPRTLEKELAEESAPSISALKPSAVNRIWMRALEKEITLKPAELTALAKKAGKKASDVQAHEAKETARLGEKLANAENRNSQQTGLRRLSVTAPTKPEDQGNDEPFEIDGEPSLLAELTHAGVTKISDLSYAAAESIIGQIEANVFRVSSDDLRQLVRLRNEERKKREPEATTLEKELAMEGVTGIAELDLEGAERIWDLVSSQLLKVETEKRRELARRRAALLSPRKPPTLTLEDELASEGVVEIGSLDEGGLQRISALVHYNELKVTPAQLRELVRRRKELQGPRTTLAEELAAEGVAAIDELDSEGVARILALIADNDLKVEARELRQLHWRDDKLNQDMSERRTLVKELIRAGADSIDALDLDGVERIIALVERETLKVDDGQLRELYQRDAILSADDAGETGQDVEWTGEEGANSDTLGTTTKPEPLSPPSVSSGRTRSNAVSGRSFGAELARIGEGDIDRLDLTAVQKLIGLVENSRLQVDTNQRRKLYRRQMKLTEPQPDEVTSDEDETPEVIEGVEDSGPIDGSTEPTLETTRRWQSGRVKGDSFLMSDLPEQSGRRRRHAMIGRHAQEGDLSLLLAREGVEDIGSLDLAGAERLRDGIANRTLSLTTSDAARLAARWRELVRIEELGQMTLESALLREDVEDIAELDLAGVERIRELVTSNKLNPTPGPDVLLKLGQQRKAMLSKENHGRTTLQAELDREKAKGIEDLDLDGVERIRGLIAAKQLEVTPVELKALARRRVELMSKGGQAGPTLADELALEGVESIAELDLTGVNRIRALIAARQLTVGLDQLNALGKQRMALRSGPEFDKTTLEAELALEGASKISELDLRGVSRIKRLVEEDRLEISTAQLRELGLRSEALPSETEPENRTLDVELAAKGAARIADLGLADVRFIRDLVRFQGLEVTDGELEQLRKREALLTERVTLAAYLARIGASTIAGLDREAVIDLWKLVEADKLDASAAELRELALKRKGQRLEVMALSKYLARNEESTIAGLNAAQIDGILNLIEEKRLLASPTELQALVRKRKELRGTPQPEPTTVSGALVQEGVKDIADLDLAAIERLWERVAQRKLRVDLDERKQLGRRRRELLRESRTLKAAVKETGAGAIASLAIADALALWERVADGELTAEKDELRQLGDRRRSLLSASRTLAFELEREGAKDIASLRPEAVERILGRIADGELRVPTEALRELARRHKYETGFDVRESRLPTLKDLAGEESMQRKVQTKLIVGAADDRYEREADRVARRVVNAPLPLQPQAPELYYQGPAYPSSAKRPPTRRRIQARLTLGPVGDRYEQEADRVARQVLAMRVPEESGDEYFSGSAYSPRGARSVSVPAPIAHSPAPAAVDDLQATALAQRTGAAFDAGLDFEERLGAARAGGAPLPEAARAFMERRMGADFGGVKVHTDAQSGQLNQMIQAKAFTTGSDVFFGRGEYNPDSSGGRELLAHELAHTVQQGAVPVQRRTTESETPVIAADQPGNAAPIPKNEDDTPLPLRRSEAQPLARSADMPAQTGAGIRRPVIQRHLLGSLADLGRSILSTLASIPENLWAALRPATDEAPAPTRGPRPLETPSLFAPEEAPPQPIAAPVVAPAIAAPVETGEALTPESIRAQVNLFDPTRGDVVRYISDRIADVITVKDLLFVVSRERLLDALAQDLAAREDGVPVDETHRQAAEREVANGGGGFTALDGRIFVLDTAAKSSALFHEVIHVLSGPGGVTRLAQLKMQLNEGFTNYFAEEVAERVGGKVYAAYAFPTTWARKFAAVHGREAAYSVYFKGDLDLLYEKLAGFLLRQAQSNKLTATETDLLKLRGEWSMDKALALVKNKVRGADFYDKNALPNQWFDGRVF